VFTTLLVFAKIAPFNASPQDPWARAALALKACEGNDAHENVEAQAKGRKARRSLKDRKSYRLKMEVR